MNGLWVSGVVVVLAAILQAAQPCHDISRSSWGARSASSTTSLSTPVDYAIVHHTATPACTSTTACKQRVRNIQTYHMNTRGWNDIGYNYLIGGDGKVYEGRGSSTKGAHAGSYNSRSQGIALIGNFQSTDPSSTMTNRLNTLLTCLKNGSKLKSTYTLKGHRQVGSTTCPGNRLYNEIKTHSHYS